MKDQIPNPAERLTLPFFNLLTMDHNCNLSRQDTSIESELGGYLDTLEYLHKKNELPFRQEKHHEMQNMFCLQ